MTKPQTESYFRPVDIQFNKLLHVVFLVTLTMELLFFTPCQGLRVLLAGFKDILRVAGVEEEIVESIPKDPRPPSNYFNLNPTISHYITCPSCDFLYAWSPGDTPDADNNPSPMLCTHKRAPESPVCDELLWKRKQTTSTLSHWVPIRKYQHQSLKAWFGRLLSRPGMESLV